MGVEPAQPKWLWLILEPMQASWAAQDILTKKKGSRFAIDPTPQGLSGPPEPRKSPKRVRKEYPGAGPQKVSKECAPESQKESESQVFLRLFSDP